MKPTHLIIEEAKEKLSTYLAQLDILTRQEIEAVMGIAGIAHLEKGDFFIQEGKVCSQLVFTVNGMLRSFFTKDDGDEVTYCFTFPNNLMTAYSSFITGNPTEENIQALTKVDLLVLDMENLLPLISSSTNWIRLQQFFAEQQYMALEKRIFSYQKERAQKRYLELIQQQPRLLQHVSLHHLASYLNITPRHLSRIRKEVLALI